MKKFLAMLVMAIMSLTCVFGFTACGDDDGKTLQVYTNAGFAPYEFLNEDGEVVGVDIDIMQEIGEILGYKVVINDIDFDKIFDEIQKDEFAVGAAGITQNAERDEIASASISYANSVQYAIVSAGTFSGSDLVEGKLSLAKLATLTNKVIGVQKGTTGQDMVKAAINEADGVLKDLGSTMFDYENAILASRDIGTQLGSVVIDRLPAEAIVSASNGTLECFALDAEAEEYVIYVNKNATELLAQINDVLDDMLNDGVIDFYTRKHRGEILSK